MADEFAAEYVAVPSVGDLAARFERVRQRFSQRDVRMSQVQMIRAGRMSEVAPDLFPATGPWQEPIVANMIDVAARDAAEALAPLPSFNCLSSNMSKQRERNNAELRTKIAQSYVSGSELQTQAYSGADRYVTYGFLPIRVEIDYDACAPVIRMLDPVGSYPVQDRFNRTVALFQRTFMDRDDLAARFPELSRKIRGNDSPVGNRNVEVVFYHDKNWDLAFMTGSDPILLDATRNPLGKCLVEVAQRPGVSDIPRGQFDDVLFVQLAKSSMALLALQAAHDAVNAPLIVPSDVPEIPYGPGATIRTNNPAGVGRMNMNLPQAAFSEQQTLDRELQLGSRFPEVRTGNADASIVTGKGVQALMGGYDSQIRGHQAIFARTFERIIGLCFEIDEKLFGSYEKTVHSAASGMAYELTYTPAKAINGDYTVQAKYGLMAGLNPSQALIFGLQARGEKLISRDFLRRELPMEIDDEDQARAIDMEDLEETAKAALLGYAQAIPQLAAQGQDVSKPIKIIQQVIADRSKGIPFADALAEAFAPEPEPKPEPAPAAPGGSPEEAMAAMLGGGAPAGPEGAPAGPEGGMPPAGPEGGMPGVPGAAPAQPPADINTLLASLSSSGAPRMSATLRRQV